MAKLPRYMKSSNPVRDLSGEWFVQVEINTRHPSFLWYLTKSYFSNYKMRSGVFWVAYVRLIYLCLMKRLFDLDS